MEISRNTVEGFIRRTRHNLEAVESKYEKQGEGHVVTQLANSLLGIVVYPWEHQGLDHLKSIEMSEIGLEGWPDQIMKLGKDKTATLGDLIHHLRNAVAHGRMTFSSDDRELGQVTLTFEDRPNKGAPTNWRAQINAQQLRQFCNWLMDKIEDTVG